MSGDNRPATTREARRWVRDFWADQMRRQNAPDLPEHISVEAFQEASEHLAARLTRAALTSLEHPE